MTSIEKYRKRADSYPASLEDLGIDLPDTRYGPWSYGTSESGYWLHVGDYGRDELELTYSTDSGWYCDT